MARFVPHDGAIRWLAGLLAWADGGMFIMVQSSIRMPSLLLVVSTLASGSIDLPLSTGLLTALV